MRTKSFLPLPETTKLQICILLGLLHPEEISMVAQSIPCCCGNVHLNAVSRGCQHWHQDWCLPCWHLTVHSNWHFQTLTLGKQHVVSCRMLFLLSGLFIHTQKTSLFKLFAWALTNVYKALTKRFAGELFLFLQIHLFWIDTWPSSYFYLFLTQGTAFLKRSPWSLFVSAISRTCAPAAGVNCSHNPHLLHLKIILAPDL